MLVSEWLLSTYRKNQIIILVLVATITVEVINKFEVDILSRIALTSESFPDNTSASSQENFTKHECHPYGSFAKENTPHQDTHFFWTEKQKYIVGEIQFYSPFFVYFFGGILSDRLGGHRIALIGMILSATIMSMLYLSILCSSNVFILMLFLRGIGQGLVEIAFMSLIGKLAPSIYRTFFVGASLATYSVGDFLGRTLSRLFLSWKIMCQLCGFVGTLTALWWWLVCRSHRFPRVRQLVKIPWKFMVAFPPFYVLIMLFASCSFHATLRNVTVNDYKEKTIFMKMSGFGPELVDDFFKYSTKMLTYIFCGAMCDFITARRYLPGMEVKRCFFVYSIAILICDLAVLRLVECSRLAVIGCYMVLQYTVALALNVCYSVAIDFSPSCTGGLIGVFWWVYGFTYFIVKKLTLVLSPDDIRSWSELYFTQFILVVVLSLPFLLCGVKQIPWSIEKSWLDRKIKRSINLKNVTNQQNTVQHSSPGPSK